MSLIAAIDNSVLNGRDVSQLPDIVHTIRKIGLIS